MRPNRCSIRVEVLLGRPDRFLLRMVSKEAQASSEAYIDRILQLAFEVEGSSSSSSRNFVGFLFFLHISCLAFGCVLGGLLVWKVSFSGSLVVILMIDKWPWEDI